MRNPPPGTLESVAEEISTSASSSSSSHFSPPHRSSVSASEAECQQRCFATATGAFFLAFSGGLAVQVELARRLPTRLRGFTSFIPAAAAILASVESYRFLSTRCSMNRRIGSRRNFGSGSSAASAAARKQSSTSSSEKNNNNNASGNFSGLLARRVSRLTSRQTNSSTNNSMECAAATSASFTINSISPSTEERNLQQQLTQQQQQQQQQEQAPVPSRPQIPVWNHITEAPTAVNNSDNTFTMIPGLP